MSASRVVLGVTGGIAAYKSPDLVRRLIERGAEVQVVMSAGARQFVTPLTFQAVSGRPVRSELWDESAEAAMGHIELARWAEHVLIAPATADFLAKLAGGRADDLLSTICLATGARVHVAPGMNRLMWAHAATRHNVEVLESRGVHVLGPGQGEQACGEHGLGRMLEPAEIAAALFEQEPLISRCAKPQPAEARAGSLSAGSLSAGTLSGLVVTITAGPTRERIDPVRYLTNRSSGKMGFAVAAAARDAGAEVILISGPVGLASPAGHITRIDVESARDMYAAVHRHIARTDIFIAAAAVADFQPAAIAHEKIKKDGRPVSLPLEPAPDIVRSVAELAHRPFVVGFAAETNDVEANALLKLGRKNLDMIAANRVGDGIAFDCDDNALTILWKEGRVEIPCGPKTDVARQLIELIAQRYSQRRTVPHAQTAT